MANHYVMPQGSCHAEREHDSVMTQSVAGTVQPPPGNDECGRVYDIENRLMDGLPSVKGLDRISIWRRNGDETSIKEAESFKFRVTTRIPVAKAAKEKNISGRPQMFST